MDQVQRIKRLKEERNAIILAHYYVDGEVQEIADYVGDSYYLSKVAKEVQEEVIVFCGVAFMGESAKILSPDKTVLMPDEAADCPMAHMVDQEAIEEVRRQYPDAAVVCYINSSAEVKRYTDVCVTSANARKVVGELPNEDIFFVPDQNLGRYLATQIPEKHFIFHDGFCHVHTSIYEADVRKAKELHPEAEVLAHPECTMDVLELADYIGSTSGIIDRASASDKKAFIICTEMGVFYKLAQKNPDKKFYSVGHRQFCPNMKRITLDKVELALRKMDPEVELDEQLRLEANRPLERMLELAGR